jgi:hypothetical protein
VFKDLYFILFLFFLIFNKFKFKMFYINNPFVDFTSQIVGRRGVPCPTNKGVSHTNLVCWLDCDLKNRLLLIYCLCF